MDQANNSNDISNLNEYPNVNIHLCKECGDEFKKGDEVVCLSDGVVNEDSNFDASNRRFWHRDCFPEAKFKE